MSWLKAVIKRHRNLEICFESLWCSTDHQVDSPDGEGTRNSLCCPASHHGHHVQTSLSGRFSPKYEILNIKYKIQTILNANNKNYTNTNYSKYKLYKLNTNYTTYHMVSSSTVVWCCWLNWSYNCSLLHPPFDRSWILSTSVYNQNSSQATSPMSFLR